MKTTIDVEELAKEAKANLLVSMDTQIAICMNPVVAFGTINMIDMSMPEVAVAVTTNRENMQSLQVLLFWYWEMGRLYGRQEIVRETVGD